MSVISNSAHNVVSYVSGTTKPFSGQRLSTITYKTIKDSKHPLCNVKRESKAVSLPVFGNDEVSANLVSLMPHIKQMMYKAQDAIIREYLDANPEAKHVSNEDISISAVVEYLDNSNESGRLTKDTVAKWFDESIADTLMIALAERLGISDVPSNEESAKIEALVSGFKDKVAALAGGKTSYEPKLCVSIKKCLALAPADDVLAARFNVRLDKMIADAESGNNMLMDAL